MKAAFNLCTGCTGYKCRVKPESNLLGGRREGEGKRDPTYIRERYRPCLSKMPAVLQIALLKILRCAVSVNFVSYCVLFYQI